MRADQGGWGECAFLRRGKRDRGESGGGGGGGGGGSKAHQPGDAQVRTVVPRPQRVVVQRLSGRRTRAEAQGQRRRMKNVPAFPLGAGALGSSWGCEARGPRREQWHMNNQGKSGYKGKKRGQSGTLMKSSSGSSCTLSHRSSSGSSLGTCTAAADTTGQTPSRPNARLAQARPLLPAAAPRAGEEAPGAPR